MHAAWEARERTFEWLASVAGLTALMERLTKAGQVVVDGSPSLWDWEAIESHVSEWIDVGGEAVAFAILNAAAVVDARLAIVDGVMPRDVVHRYVESIRRHLESLPAVPTREIEIREGRTGAGGVSKGAALLLLFRSLFSAEPDDFAG